jgi:chromate transport protein ChrA
MTALPIEFEILIPLVMALFFSLLYELDRDENQWTGWIGMVLWLSNMFVWLIVSSYPVIALVFFAVWIIYVVRLVLQQFKPLQQKRRLQGDTD